MIKAIVFDFDDTLEDWSHSRINFHKKVNNKVARMYGVDPDVFYKKFYAIEMNIVQNRNGLKKFDRSMWFKKTFRALGIKYKPKDVDELVKYYWDGSFKAVKLFPGALNTVKLLSKKYKLGILTDSDGGKDIKIKRIKKFSICKYFDVVTTGEDMKASKPDPKCFRYVLRKLGVKPSEAVMVGDNLTKDLAGAKSVGMKTIWIRQGHWVPFVKKKDLKYADYTVKSIKNVPKIIEKIVKNEKTTKKI